MRFANISNYELFVITETLGQSFYGCVRSLDSALVGELYLFADRMDVFHLGMKVPQLNLSRFYSYSVCSIMDAYNWELGTFPFYSNKFGQSDFGH